MLREFWEIYPDAKKPLEAWYTDAKQSTWKNPNEIKRVYRNASVVGNNRVVFNIKGNDYRLVAAVNYSFGIVYVRFIGTHSQYDKIDAVKI
jgi:mRNA interferase HigB